MKFFNKIVYIINAKKIVQNHTKTKTHLKSQTSKRTPSWQYELPRHLETCFFLLFIPWLTKRSVFLPEFLFITSFSSAFHVSVFVSITIFLCELFPVLDVVGWWIRLHTCTRTDYGFRWAHQIGTVDNIDNAFVADVWCSYRTHYWKQGNGKRTEFPWESRKKTLGGKELHSQIFTRVRFRG